MSQKSTLFVILAVLIMPVAHAAIESFNVPETGVTGELVPISLYLRAERNYSVQHVNVTIKSDKIVLFNGCNGSYSDSFTLNSRSTNIIKPKVIFTKSGQYVIEYVINNVNYNQTGQNIINIVGNDKNINSSCTKSTGQRRERYGQNQYSPVKDRIKNTIRKYAIW